MEEFMDKPKLITPKMAARETISMLEKDFLILLSDEEKKQFYACKSVIAVERFKRSIITTRL